MPIGSLAGPPRRRSNRPRPRVLFLLSVTLITLVVLFVVSRRGSGHPAVSAGTRVESKTTSRHPTSTAGTSTTVYDVSINPAWPEKGTSRYSDSAASKSIGDQLGDVTTTSTRSGSAASTSLGAGHGPSSTLRRTTTTSFTRLSTTTRLAPRVTAAPPTTAAPTTSPAPPTTAAPPQTTPPAAPTP